MVLCHTPHVKKKMWRGGKARKRAFLGLVERAVGRPTAALQRDTLNSIMLSQNDGGLLSLA